MILPTRGSLLAEIVPTWRTPSVPFTGLDTRESSLTVTSQPFCRAATSRAGAAPAVMARKPMLKIDSVRSVAVVVPSPATSEVLLATSFTS